MPCFEQENGCNGLSSDNIKLSSGCNNGHQKIKVVLLWSCYNQSNSIFKDNNDSPPTGFFDHNPDPDRYEFHIIGLDKNTAVQTIQNFIQEKKYDIYINGCDGLETDDTAGIEVAEYLWCQDSVPFVSPTCHFFLLSKFQMKIVATLCSIATPSYFFIYNSEQMINLKNSGYKNLKFPLLVKHHNGAGSEGLSKKCLVYCCQELEERMTDMIKAYGGALVEEFVKGREFTVLVQENPESPQNPIVYQPFECLLPNASSFKDFDRKFTHYESLEWKAVEEEHVAMELRTLTKRMFIACNANMYARCDFRMDEATSKIYFLEINVLPGVFGPKINYCSADYILDYEQKFLFFMQNLLTCAQKNFQDHKQHCVTTVSGPICGYLTSKKRFQKSEPIICLTSLPHRLVNASEFDRFPDDVSKFFYSTSVPVTKNLRLWLYNGGWKRQEFEVTALKRSSKPEEVNCILDANLSLVACKDIAENQMFVLGQKFS